MTNSNKQTDSPDRKSPDKRSKSHTSVVNKSSEIQPMIISKQSSDDDYD